ncbi:protein pecanex [Anaeramoeba flamelloides]|uniref:Protein pecanex n=1 Tax=Anaeramoeba flamelloides TaxID=1746091 RepID=A0AAV7YFV4_9EUKA|nr:protein pecanex [Anaeramoeba flamelloides]
MNNETLRLLRKIPIFLRKTLIATLTGGYHYSPHLPLMTNVIHIYLFSFFLLVPLAFSKITIPKRDSKTIQKVIWGLIYTFITTTAFSIIKYINYDLHKQFDKQEDKKKKNQEQKKENDRNKQILLNQQLGSTTTSCSDQEDQNFLEKTKNSHQVKEKKKKTDFEDDSEIENEIEIEKEKEKEKEREKKNSNNKNPNNVIITDETESSTDSDELHKKKDFNFKDNEITIPYLGNSLNEPLLKKPPNEEEEKEIEDLKEIAHKNNSKVYIKLLFIKIEVFFNRRELETFFDRDYKNLSIFFSILSCVCISFFSFLVSEWFYNTYFLLLFVSVATAQYSLLKSPQPDSTSTKPGSGESVYSRSMYITFFSICIIILKLCEYSIRNGIMVFLGYYFRMSYFFDFAVMLLQIILITLPLLFLFGIFPRPTTFLMYICEQVNIYFLGGTASISVIGSLLQAAKGILLVLILFMLSTFLVDRSRTIFYKEWSFGFFVGLIIAFAFLLSRSSSSIEYCEEFFKLKKIKKKKKKSISQKRLTIRIVLDLIHTILITIISSIIFWSGLIAFLSKYPTVVFLFCTAFGWVLHYLIPQLRCLYPFQLFVKCFLKNEQENLFIQNMMNDEEDDDNDNDDDDQNQYSRKIFLFEKIYRIGCYIEKYCFVPLIWMITAYKSSYQLYETLSLDGLELIFIITGLKFVQGGLNNANQHYKIIFLTIFFWMWNTIKETNDWLLNLFILHLIVQKLMILIEKIKFVYVYSNPFNRTIKSALQIIISLLGISLSTWTLFLCFFTTIFSMPIVPLFGTLFWIPGYAHPSKFFEHNYDHDDNDVEDKIYSLNNKKSLLNNSNSIKQSLNLLLYRNILMSLESQLYEDIRYGRLGTISSGDIYIILNDKLTLILQIIEIGNGYCSFQIRGLDTSGEETLCHNEEKKSIQVAMDNPQENWYCCNIFLTIKDIFAFRNRVWKIINKWYYIKTYDKLKYRADEIYQQFDTKKNLINFFIRSICFYIIQKNSIFKRKLSNIFKNPAFVKIQNEIILKNSYIEKNTSIFNSKVDPDFDILENGINYQSFLNVYENWINYCLKIINLNKGDNFGTYKIPAIFPRELISSDSLGDRESDHDLYTLNYDSSDDVVIIDFEKKSEFKIEKNGEKDNEILTHGENENNIKALCFLISILLRKHLATSNIDHDEISKEDSFIDNYILLFRGGMKFSFENNIINSWVNQEIEFITRIGVNCSRTASYMFHLHQGEEDLNSDETIFKQLELLNNNDINKDPKIILTPEIDPKFQSSIKNLKPTIFSLTKSIKTDLDNERIVKYNNQILNLNLQQFSLIKLNSECAKGLWNSQIQEVIYFRNFNAERDTVQKSSNLLRNLQVQAVDLPVGYPLFISPICYSFSNRHLKFLGIFKTFFEKKL